MAFLALDKDTRERANTHRQVLLDAVLRSDYESVRSGLDVTGDLQACLLGKVMGFNNPLLSAAVAKEDIEMVRLLLDAGFAIECSGFGSDLVSPTYEAVEAGAIDIVDLLANRGASMNRMRLSRGQTMLHAAISKGSVPMALYLIDLSGRSDLDLFATDSDNRTALDLACLHDLPEVHGSLWLRGVRGARVVTSARAPLTHAIAFAEAIKVVTSCLPDPDGSSVPDWVVQAIATVKGGERHPAFLAWQTENAIAASLSTQDAEQAFPRRAGGPGCAL